MMELFVYVLALFGLCFLMAMLLWEDNNKN